MRQILDKLRKSESLLLALAFIIVAFELSLFVSQSSADSWWLLKSGEALWNGTFTFEDQWSYTANGMFWPDHEIAFQWVFYALWLLGGETFVLGSILGIILTLGTLALLIPPKQLRDKFGGRFGALSFFLLIAFGVVIGPYISLRPSTFSFFFTALIIQLILRNKPLWVPLVTLVWIQFHGSVIFGIGLVGFAMGLHGIRFFMDIHNKEKLRKWGQYLSATVLSGVTLFLSPMGLRFIDYSLSTAQYRNSYISEWKPLPESPVAFAIGLTIMGLVSLVVAIRLRKFLLTWEGVFLTALTVLIFLVSLGQLRLLASVVLLAFPILFLGLGARRENPFKITVVPKWIAATVTAFSVLLSSAGIVWALELSYPGAHRDPFAPGTVREALLSEECLDHTWNDYNSGGYLMWFVPEVKVSIDSRYDLYPLEIKIAGGIYPSDTPEDNGIPQLQEQLKKYDINCYVSMTVEDIEELKSRNVEVIAENAEVVVFRFENNSFPTK